MKKKTSKDFRKRFTFKDKNICWWWWIIWSFSWLLAILILFKMENFKFVLSTSILQEWNVKNGRPHCYNYMGIFRSLAYWHQNTFLDIDWIHLWPILALLFLWPFLALFLAIYGSFSATYFGCSFYNAFKSFWCCFVIYIWWLW